MRRRLLVCVVGLVPFVAMAQSATPTEHTRFDGDWMVTIDCPSNTEESGAKGYRYEFPATVAEGRLSGRHGEEGTAGSLRVEGAIAPGGDALLVARGRTGNPLYAVKQPSSGTPYAYRIKAHFEPTRGTGTRIESRVCNFDFAKR